MLVCIVVTQTHELKQQKWVRELSVRLLSTSADQLLPECKLPKQVHSWSYKAYSKYPSSSYGNNHQVFIALVNDRLITILISSVWEVNPKDGYSKSISIVVQYIASYRLWSLVLV